MLWLASAQRDFDDGSYDGDLCPTAASGPSGLAVLLFDLTKPLVGLPPGLPGQLLRDLTLEVERDTEVRTYLLTGSSSAPRVLLRRLCKPYDADAIHLAKAKDHDGGARDCDDLPAQMAPEKRRSASRFCALREALASRLNTLAQRASEGSWEVAGAHLVEALEQTRADLLAHGGSRRVLHIVSDMVQHADWYSHLDLPSETWNDDGHARFRDSSHRLGRRWGGTADIDVHIDYLPREGLTVQPEAGSSHRRFWRWFFGAENLTFHDQPPLPAYASTPLMDGMEPSDTAAHGDAVLTAAAPPVPAAVEEPLRMAEPEAPKPSAAEPPTQVERRALEAPPPLDPAANPVQPQTTAVTVAADPSAAEESRDNPTPGGGQAASPAVALAAAPQEELGDPPQPRSAPLPEADDALIADQPVEEAQAGIDLRTADSAQAQAADDRAPVEAQSQAPECSQTMLNSILTQEGGPHCSWCPEYPRGGRRNFGDAQIAVTYLVNDAGEVEPESVKAVEQESVLDRPGYYETFAHAAVAAVRDWRFSLVSSEGRVCTPRASAYKVILAFEF